MQVVSAYMGHVQLAAEMAVRDMLGSVSARIPASASKSGDGGAGADVGGDVVLEASDRMDDGTMIRLKVTIDRKTRSCVMDFTGTGPEGNIGERGRDSCL